MIKSYNEFLLEMPRKIKPLKNTEEKVAKVWSAIKASNDFTELKKPGLNGYHMIEKDDQLLIVSPDWTRCVYYVNLETVTNLGNKAIRQIYVWSAKDRQSGASSGLMFWDTLLPMFGCIVTDTEQTDDGESFWLRRLQEAFRFGYNVSWIDARTLEVKHMKDIDEVHSNSELIWGTTSKHSNQLLMICDPKIQDQVNGVL